MSLQNILGTCGKCGGAVILPPSSSSATPLPPRCATCGARPVNAYGPKLEMASTRLPPPYSTPEQTVINRITCDKHNRYQCPDCEHEAAMAAMDEMVAMNEEMGLYPP